MNMLGMNLSMLLYLVHHHHKRLNPELRLGHSVLDCSVFGFYMKLGGNENYKASSFLALNLFNRFGLITGSFRVVCPKSPDVSSDTWD